MKGRRQQRIELIRAVENEYKVIAVALGVLRVRLAADPSDLKRHRLERGHFERSLEKLSATYPIRLFAEFETALREAWGRAYCKTSHPRSVELLEAFAARCAVPPKLYASVDDVRRYRNALVHEEDQSVAAIPIADAGKTLRRFLSWLPTTW